MVLLLWGRALTLGRGTIEVQTIAGWGGLAFVLTLWGVFRTEPLWWPVAGVAAVAGMALLTGRLALRRDEWTALLRIMVLALPIWAIMLTARPSQPDTFLNLLPNAAYLYDHGMLPANARTTRWSAGCIPSKTSRRDCKTPLPTGTNPIAGG